MRDARASDKGRATAYFFVGVMGVGITSWFMGLLLKHGSNSDQTLGIFIFWVAVVVIYFFCFVAFYAAYGFKYGRVDEVTGSMRSAVLIQNGKPIREAARIHLKRNYDQENTKLTDEERDVLFICDWRPWVCSRRTFRCVDDREGSASN